MSHRVVLSLPLVMMQDARVLQGMRTEVKDAHVVRQCWAMLIFSTSGKPVLSRVALLPLIPLCLRRESSLVCLCRVHTISVTLPLRA